MKPNKVKESIQQRRIRLIKEAIQNGLECVDDKIVGHICLDRLSERELREIK